MTSVVVIVVVFAPVLSQPARNPPALPVRQWSITTVGPRGYTGEGGWGANASDCQLPIWRVFELNASSPIDVYVANQSGTYYDTSNHTLSVTDPMYSWGPVEQLTANVSVPVRNPLASVFNPSLNESVRVRSAVWGLDWGYCS